jgi:hypothetical protein
MPTGMLAKVGWKVFAGLSAFAAMRLTAKALTGGWRAATHREPPANPASPQTGWGEAIAWAGASGVAVGVARLAARRGAAGAWQRASGSLPPGVEAAAPV